MTNKKSPKATADYKVGRGKPPRETQFKPGQSGNAGGRTKGCLNAKTIFENVFGREIVVTENGKRVIVTYAEAIILKQAEGGMKGDSRAAKNCIDLIERHLGSKVELMEELHEDDRTIVERALRSRQTRRSRKTAAVCEAPSPDKKDTDDAA